MRYLLLLLAPVAGVAQEPLSPREKMLLERIEKLEQRLAAIEARTVPASREPEVSPRPAETAPAALASGMTINAHLDGYYGYNFNRPFTAANALRAYDVSANSFAINQAGLIVERTPDVSGGRRIGGRLDVMFGPATETLQASPANEPRPQVFRHLFQAYGTYVAPLGRGLQVDFGKWASAFGIENNYTKDQFNYSRSYWFSFLPFYHMGVRVTYPLTPKINAGYWLTNGLNQTEDFNGFKSQAVLLGYNPTAKLSANLNYFNGQEQRAALGRALRGRSHFVDSYIAWQATDRWTFAAQGDYAIERVTPESDPRVVMGGAGYARYHFTPRFNLAGRFAYLNDADGLFSGERQALKDATLTATLDVASGFQMRWEARRDWSDAAFFHAQNLDRRKRGQITALVGLIWWLGGKQGLW